MRHINDHNDVIHYRPFHHPGPVTAFFVRLRKFLYNQFYRRAVGEWTDCVAKLHLKSGCELTVQTQRQELNCSGRVPTRVLRERFFQQPFSSKDRERWGRGGLPTSGGNSCRFVASALKHLQSPCYKSCRFRINMALFADPFAGGLTHPLHLYRWTHLPRTSSGKTFCSKLFNLDLAIWR